MVSLLLVHTALLAVFLTCHLVACKSRLSQYWVSIDLVCQAIDAAFSLGGAHVRAILLAYYACLTELFVLGHATLMRKIIVTLAVTHHDVLGGALLDDLHLSRKWVNHLQGCLLILVLDRGCVGIAFPRVVCFVFFLSALTVYFYQVFHRKFLTRIKGGFISQIVTQL